MQGTCGQWAVQGTCGQWTVQGTCGPCRATVDSTGNLEAMGSAGHLWTVDSAGHLEAVDSAEHLTDFSLLVCVSYSKSAVSGFPISEEADAASYAAQKSHCDHGLLCPKPQKPTCNVSRGRWWDVRLGSTATPVLATISCSWHCPQHPPSASAQASFSSSTYLETMKFCR